jgi:Ca-activated chloride channel family protein
MTHLNSRFLPPLAATVAFTLGLLPLTAPPVLAAGSPAELGRVGLATAPQEAAGELVLRSRSGEVSQQAVRLGTDMKVTVSGPLARITVTQAFLNTSRSWVEATYLFPMPTDSAVDSLKMVVGDRIIIGEIQPRAEARATYEKARDEGKTVSLMEQQRPNMFTTKVANVGPGETVMISIEYQVAVELNDDRYGLHLPLVVAPRYVPPHTVLVEGPEGPQFIPEGLDDAEAVTAPLISPQQAATREPAPLSISVQLNPGFALSQVSSPSHKVIVSPAQDDKTGPLVTLNESEGAGNRDFELTWTASTRTATTALFQETWSGDHYLMAVVNPPKAEDLPPPPKRELVFVIDNSGSMGGESMEQAKASLALALQSLKPDDTFNVIRFDDSLELLFPTAVAASRDKVERALGFAAQLTADGGTEMVPALRAALVDPTPKDERLRQVIFLTDGAISNEQEMLGILGHDKGRSRVFMVGIGSAPNSYLMSRMAEVGQGSYIPIADIAQVQERMKTLLNRLTQPAVTDLRLISTNQAIDLTPTPLVDQDSQAVLGGMVKAHQLPDLYAGEPLVVMGYTRQMQGRLIVQGRIGDTPWSQVLDLSQAQAAPGVAKQWARRRITDVELASTLGKLDWEQTKEAIAALGLTFELVTSQTSLVAVDHTPRRPEGARLTQEELPLPLPKGWDFDALFGGPTPASPTLKDSETGRADLMPLPQTGTWSTVLQLSGAVLALFGLFGLWLGRRQRGGVA